MPLPYVHLQNELCMMEMIHFIVESLDKHFGNVCELDILFHLDEVGRRNHEESRYWKNVAFH